MKRNKKLITLILLVLLCLGLAVTGSVAAYNKTSFVKRVITTKSGSSELRFSSNYLSHMRQGDSYPQKVIRISGAGLSVGVTVCNYPQSDITKFSSEDITFDLTVKLLDSALNPVTDSELISKIQVNNGPLKENFTTSKTLPGGKSSMELFNFVCTDASNLKDYSLRIEAIPTDTGMDRLGADLKLTSGEAMETAWDGGFGDDQKRLSKEYDAFNYVISGSAEGTVTLTVSDKIKISDFSFEELNATQTGNDISFHVGGEGKPTSYRLQFYRTTAIPADETWATVNGYITFKFEQSKANE
ncbi:MAG: hypothetical protein PUK18_02220 [Firmicutes bacterium]|nr:hypothetical protein [Bacillota bacterium]MDY6160418.1 hypothetical protein [Candidatus Faecousia sp.]